MKNKKIEKVRKKRHETVSVLIHEAHKSGLIREIDDIDKLSRILLKASCRGFVEGRKFEGYKLEETK